jgi:zinc and cadmium transporter
MDYLLLLSTIALGAVSVLSLRLHEPRYIKLLNTFTGAYLLCLTLLHLLPELYHTPTAQGHAHDGSSSAFVLGVLMLAGFYTQVALDVISMGVEHGHSHDVRGHMPYGIIIGLSLHALIEAMALGSPTSHYDPASRKMLLWSIVLHNYPVSIALLGTLLHSGMSPRASLGLLAVFAAMAPLGMFLSANTDLAEYSRELMAFVIGIFMHIATTILFESSDIHRFNVAKLVAIFIGTGLGFLSLLMH